jgi:Domain of unknown function (DUF1840)
MSSRRAKTRTIAAGAFSAAFLFGGRSTMIYKFKSKATGDLIMTQPVAERVLSLIGKPATPQGIIEVDQLQAAMSALEAAAAAEGPVPGGHAQGRPGQPAPARVADGRDDQARARGPGAHRLGRLNIG